MGLGNIEKYINSFRYFIIILSNKTIVTISITQKENKKKRRRKYKVDIFIYLVLFQYK